MSQLSLKPGPESAGRRRRRVAVDDRRSSTSFRPDIEGLRAVAVLAVVLFHAEVPGVNGGYVGVDVFFVISGFLITGLLWREANSSGTVRLRRFYGARARRLLPASALVCVVTAIASVLLLPPLQARSALGDGIASALYVSNFWFGLQGIDYLAPYQPESPYLHYWSLGVEEQFYLVWPALILVTAWLIRHVRRRARTEAMRSTRPYLVVLAVVAVASFAVSLVCTYVLPYVAFFSLPTRAWQLAAGGLIALTAARWQRLSARSAALMGWAGLVMILVACVVFSPATYYPGTAALLPVVGAALIIAAGCATPTQGCGSVLKLSPMQAMGRVSYSWYLWHWPVLLLAPLLFGHALGLAGRIAAALFALLLAMATLRLVENPLRFAEPIRRSAGRSLALGAAVTAVAVAVCASLITTVAAPVGRGEAVPPMEIVVPAASAGQSIGTQDDEVEQAYAQVQAAVAAGLETTAVPSNLTPSIADAAADLEVLYSKGCMLKLFEVRQPECLSGDTASSTTVALIGDSHAAMWSSAFQLAAERMHWRLETLTKANCPVMDLTITNPLRRLASADCLRWREDIVTRLKNDPPKLVVMDAWRGYGSGHTWLSGFTSYDPTWLDSMKRIVAQLRGYGSKVLVLGPIPEMGAASICLSGHLDDAAACSRPTSAAVNASGIAAEAAAVRAGGGEYLDVTKLFCTADRCPGIVGNTLVYFDWTHMSSAYSSELAPVVGALGARALHP